MGGKASRDKGAREERAVVHSWQEAGFVATRVPLSGAMKGYPGDVLIEVGLDEPLQVECKHRESISKQLWTWLEGNDILTLRRNAIPGYSAPPRLVVMTEADAQKLYKDAERWRTVGEVDCNLCDETITDGICTKCNDGGY